MILAHRIRLKPTTAQRQAFEKAAGTARYTYNWALAECEKAMAAGTFVGTKFIAALKSRWNQEKPAWVRESPKDANQQPFSNLSTTFTRWMVGLGGKPRFKRKGVCSHAFYVSNDKIEVNGLRIRLPVIGWIRMTEELRLCGKITSATVLKTTDHWYVAIRVNVGDNYNRGQASDDVVGIDLGIKDFAVTSEGEVFVGPKPHKRLFSRLRKSSRSLSRKVKFSANWLKAKARLARLHQRIAAIRHDFIHKFTKSIASRYGTIRIENLNVRGMVRLRSLARGVVDQGFYETRRQLTYKAPLYGGRVEIIPRFYPSSKTCSGCGTVKTDLRLSDRVFRCRCGLELDRDLNAAINIATYTAGSAVSACGAEGPDRSTKSRSVKPVATKQELSFELRKQAK